MSPETPTPQPSNFIVGIYVILGGGLTFVADPTLFSLLSEAPV